MHQETDRREITFLVAAFATLIACVHPATTWCAPPEREGSPSSYLADMRDAFIAANAGDMIRARELLGRQRLADPDPRAWEWYHLQALCREPSFALRRHTEEVRTVAWSADGKRLASGAQDGRVKIWDVIAEKEGPPVRGELPASVYALAWTQDGKRLAAVSGNLKVKVWDATNGKEAFAIEDLRGALNGRTYMPVLEWSPDGKRLVVVAGDEVVRVYDAGSGAQVQALKGHTNRIAGAVWSPDSKRVASASNDKTIKVWDVGAGKEFLTLTGSTGPLCAAAWSPDGKRVAAVGMEQPLRVWNAENGKQVFTQHLDAPFVQGPGQLAWTQDGRQITLHGGTFGAWDVATWAEMRSPNTRREGYLSPDGRRLLVGTPIPSVLTGRVMFIDATTDRPIQLFRGFERPEWMRSAAALAWSPDGRRVAAGGTRGTILVWNLAATAQRLFPVREAGTPAWGADGRQLLQVDSSLAIASWDVVAGEHRTLLDGVVQTRVVAAEWDPECRRLAAAYADGMVRIWPVATKEQPLVLRGFGKEVTALLWSLDGKRLAAATNDGRTMVWDTASGKEVFSHAMREAQPIFNPQVLAWASDNRLLAVVARNTFSVRVRVWDTATGKEGPTLDPRPQNPVENLVWSPDGKWLAAQQNGGALQVWDVGKGRELLNLKTTGAVYSVAWSPDSKRLAYINQGQGLKVVIVEVATKRELLALEDVGIASALTWSPDGKQLAVVGGRRRAAKLGFELAGTLLDATTGKTSTSLSPIEEIDRGIDHVWVSWSPDGKHIAGGRLMGGLVTWDAKTGKVVLSQSGQYGRVAWNASGPRPAFVKWDVRLQTLEAKSGDESRFVGGTWWGKWGEGPTLPTAVAWSGDRRQLALIIDSSAIEVRQIPSGAKGLTSTGHQGLASLAWSPDDRRLAAARFDGPIEVWDVATARSVVRITGGKAPRRPDGTFLPQSWTPPLAWSPDGNRLAANGEGRTVVIWDAVTGKELSRLSGHEGDVLAMAWSPDGKRLVTGSTDRTLKVWEAATGREVQSLSGHGGPVFSVAWSPNGRRLASVGQHDVAWEGPGAAMLWDAATGQKIATWLHQLGPVTWSLDGRRLASLTIVDPAQTPLLAVWDAPPADEETGEPGPKTPKKVGER